MFGIKEEHFNAIGGWTGNGTNVSARHVANLRARYSGEYSFSVLRFDFNFGIAGFESEFNRQKR